MKERKRHRGKMRNKTLQDRNIEKLGKDLTYTNDLVWDVIGPKEKEEKITIFVLS